MAPKGGDASASGVSESAPISGIIQSAATLSLRELNTRSARLGLWDIGVFHPELHTWTYQEKGTGKQKQGAAFRCILVAVDDPGLYISAQTTMRGTDMAPLDRAKAKFQADLQFRLSKVSLDTRAKQEYLHTPLKVVVDIGKTTVAPLLQGKQGESTQPCPQMTLRDCNALHQAQRFDLTCLVESISDARPISANRKCIALKLIDDSGTEGKIQEMTLNYFYDHPPPMLPARRSTSCAKPAKRRRR